MSDEPVGMRRKAAQLADLCAVQKKLVSVIDGWHENGETRILFRRPGNLQVATVPGESNVAFMTLEAPWLVGGDLLPGGIVQGR